MGDHNIRVPNEWPMVFISDNKDYSVFPPINHENLTVFSNHHIPQSQSQSQSQSPPSSSSSPSFSTSACDTCDTWGDYSSSSSSLSSPFDSQVRKGGLFTGWLSIGLQILRSKLLSAVSSFRNPSPHKGPIWSFGIPAATVIILVMLLTRRKKNRRRNLTPNETRLINIIKEKDGRIAQLLHQIAQMNEILIDRHKALAAKVPQ